MECQCHYSTFQNTYYFLTEPCYGCLFPLRNLGARMNTLKLLGVAYANYNFGLKTVFCLPKAFLSISVSIKPCCESKIAPVSTKNWNKALSCFFPNLIVQVFRASNFHRSRFTTRQHNASTPSTSIDFLSSRIDISMSRFFAAFLREYMCSRRAPCNIATPTVSMITPSRLGS